MYELKTNTAIRIPIGPLVDFEDGKTAETSVTVASLLVQIYQMKNDGSAVIRSAFSPTATGGSHDMIHVASDTAGIYDLELTATDTNFLGNGRITFYDVDSFLVHYSDLQIVSAAYFDWKYGTTLPSVIASSLGSQAKADVNAEVVDAISTDTYAEPGQGAPAATTSLASKIGYMYKTWRNKLTNDGTDVKLYNDAGDTVDQKATISEDSGTVTRGEFGSGA